MRESIERPAALIDVTRLSTTIEERDGGLVIGAAARNTAIAEHRAHPHPLVPCSPAPSSPAPSAQIRNMATAGGNILQRTRCAYFYDDDGSRCNKRNPGEGLRRHRRLQPHPRHPRRLYLLRRHPPVGHVRGPRRPRTPPSTSKARRAARTMKLTDLHRLPGDTPDRETELLPGELITEIELPPPVHRREIRLPKGAATARVTPSPSSPSPPCWKSRRAG